MSELEPEVIRLSLDINVFFADALASLRGIRGTACTRLVEAVRDGMCPAGPVQLITSVPVIESWADVLCRHFRFPREAAEEKASLLYDYATEGALGFSPGLVVGSGHVPFASEEDERQALAAHGKSENLGKLFDEIAEDRHVLISALAGRADILASADIADFRRASTMTFQDRDDVFLIESADHALVVARPAFVAYWFERGTVPNAAHLLAHPEHFVPKAAKASP